MDPERPPLREIGSAFGLIRSGDYREPAINELFVNNMIYHDGPKPLTILLRIVFIAWIISIIAEALGIIKTPPIYEEITIIVGWGILIVYLLVALVILLELPSKETTLAGLLWPVIALGIN